MDVSGYGMFPINFYTFISADTSILLNGPLSPRRSASDRAVSTRCSAFLAMTTTIITDRPKMSKAKYLAKSNTSPCNTRSATLFFLLALLPLAGATATGPPPSPAPPCSIDGPFTFTGASDSYLSAVSRTGIVGGGLGFTLSAWVYRETSNAMDRLIDFGNGAPADNIVFAFNNGCDSTPNGMIYTILHQTSDDNLCTNGSPLPANTWKHIAVVHSRANLLATSGPATIYLDGVSVATTSSMRFPLPVSRSGMYVGKPHVNWHPMFDGQMKDLFVWDVALSTAELDAVRLGGGLPATPPPLISMMRTWCSAAAALTAAASAAATSSIVRSWAQVGWWAAVRGVPNGHLPEPAW